MLTATILPFSDYEPLRGYKKLIEDAKTRTGVNYILVTDLDTGEQTRYFGTDMTVARHLVGGFETKSAKTYFASFQIIGSLPVIRIFALFSFKRTEDGKVGLFELYRICIEKFSKEEIHMWKEYRDGKCVPFHFYQFYLPGSIFMKLENFPSTDNFLYHRKPLDFELAVINNTGLPKPSLPYSRWFDLFKKYADCERQLLKKSHINKNVPDIVLEDLNKTIAPKRPQPNPVIKKTKNFLSCRQYHQKLYITKDNIYYFSYNKMREEWSSSTWNHTMDLCGSLYFPKDKFDDYMRGTVFENMSPNIWSHRVKFASPEVGWLVPEENAAQEEIDFNYLESKRRYPAINQLEYCKLFNLAKCFSYNVATNALQYSIAGNNKDNHELSHRLSRKQDMWEILGISKNQLKLLKDVSPNLIGTSFPIYFYKLFSDPIVKFVVPDLQERVCAIVLTYYANVYYNFITSSNTIEPDEQYKQAHFSICKSLAKRIKMGENARELAHIPSEYRDYYISYKQLTDCYKNTKNKELKAYLTEALSHLPVRVKASKVHWYHDRLIAIVREATIIENKEKNQKIDKAIVRRNSNPQNKEKYEYSSDEYSILLPQNALEIRNEGIALNHCVGQYVEYVASGSTNILFVRKNSEIEKPLLTMEVKNNCICQLYGYHDTFNKDADIAKFIRDYAKKNNFDINCVIYKKE